MTASSLMTADAMTVGYGSVPIVRDLSLHVEPGELVVLLGSNGAGKTTTVKALTGVLPIMRGRVTWQGSSVATSLHRRVRAGLGYVPEARAIISKLTVGENLQFGIGDPKSAFRYFPELEPLWKRKAGLISGGEQRMLSLARALSHEPVALIADELSLGLAPLIVRRLLGVIRERVDGGTGALLVEQHASLALKYADRAYVLRRGRLVWDGPASEAREQVRDIEGLYLGAANGIDES